MLCAIHQPQYLPWLGYFDKIDRADVFVLLDDTQFKKNEWQNRNRIKTSQGWQWLTVPVCHHLGLQIREVEPNSKVKWQRKHWQALLSNYGKAPYFREYADRLEAAYHREWANLAELNAFFIGELCDMLGMGAKLITSSTLPGDKGVATEALVNICSAVGADAYLSGAGGHDYVEEGRFQEAGISLSYQDYQHPVYPQLFGDFVSHLSVVDLLLNCGPSSLDVLRHNT